MAKLSEFRVDTRAINDGAWMRVDETLYGDLEILTRGFTDEFTDAQNARLRKAAQAYNDNQDRIGNAERREINATLLREFLVLDVRNLEGDDGQPVQIAQFWEMLSDPQYFRLARACWEAAGRVTSRSEAEVKRAQGNSALASPGS